MNINYEEVTRHIRNTLAYLEDAIKEANTYKELWNLKKQAKELLFQSLRMKYSYGVKRAKWCIYLIEQKGAKD